MNQDLPIQQREGAVSSLVYEANARLSDPVYGCAGAIYHLQNQVTELQIQLAVARAKIHYIKMQNEQVIPTPQINQSYTSYFIPDEFAQYLNYDISY